ncbi:hypothetical protein Cgig2_014304 [Carnegiea gigantea]|uniref:Reverse transcriptase zinc-binding domain-containing protein n=1 Tax=Carnegiea gigantea TaxID=171969 RepID=A0A9Q1JW38_9CARY|nr:hypothetical protein Cgig2_014304 [Carnegiea gigantea]
MAQRELPKVAWAKMVWSRTNIPRHAFVLWTFIQQRLPTKLRLSKFTLQLETTCSLCNTAIESDNHIIYECPYARDVRNGIQKWWSLPATTHQEIMHHLIKTRGTQAKMQVNYAVYAATVYYIWHSRNHQFIPPHQTVKWIKEQPDSRRRQLGRSRGLVSTGTPELIPNGQSGPASGVLFLRSPAPSSFSSQVSQPVVVADDVALHSAIVDPKVEG